MLYLATTITIDIILINILIIPFLTLHAHLCLNRLFWMFTLRFVVAAFLVTTQSSHSINLVRVYDIQGRL